jgi:group I intron endonuclease
MHENRHLQNSYNKNGKQSFIWEVIEYVDSNESKNLLKDELLKKEQYWMDYYWDSGLELYNIPKLANSNLGIKFSDSTKAKLSEAHTGKRLSEEHKKKMSESQKRIGNKPPSWKGKHHTEETKEKLRKIFKDSKYDEVRKKIAVKKRGSKHSDETKEKLRQVALNRPDETRKNMSEASTCKKKVINLTTGEIFNSLTEAAKIYNSTKSNISKACRGETKTSGGFKWSFYDEADKIKKCKKRKVINLNTGEIFDSIKAAATYYNISKTGIIGVCKGIKNYCGIDQDTNEFFKWTYYEG